MIMTIQKMWESFKVQIYPFGMDPDEEHRIRDAFYSGCWFAFENMTEISTKKTEKEAMVILGAMESELMEYAKRVPK